MKLVRMLLALALVGILTGVAYVSQATESSGEKMADAAEKFVNGLTAEQKNKAVFDFDSKERTNWHFVPRQDEAKRSTRKGLPMEEMTQEQKEAARALLRAGTTSDGFTTATTIMSLESILKELEKGGSMVRNPGWYFFTIFGTPSKTGKWGWRVEGHHLSLNLTIDSGKVIAATPSFFGANPATVKQGPRKGERTLAEAEDLAKDLFKALDDEQRKVALQEKQFREIEEANIKPTVDAPQGLAAAKMTEEQRGILLKLLQAYSRRMPPEVAEAEMTEVKKDLDQVHFAYAGGVEPGKAHTYRIQGPTFVVEFLNVQADSARNPANHIHSVWRHLKGDFGLDR
jgi:hypothetical protein